MKITNKLIVILKWYNFIFKKIFKFKMRIEDDALAKIFTVGWILFVVSGNGPKKFKGKKTICAIFKNRSLIFSSNICDIYLKYAFRVKT